MRTRYENFPLMRTLRTSLEPFSNDSHPWINRFFETPFSIGAQDLATLSSSFGQLVTHSGTSWEATEEQDYYLLTVDVPGIPKENIKMEVNHQVLTVTGQRTQRSGERTDRRSEPRTEKALTRDSTRPASKSTFQASFQLPEGIDESKIEATLQDGVLQLAIPKVPVARPKEIKIMDPRPGGLLGKLLGQSGGKEKDHFSQPSENPAA